MRAVSRYALFAVAVLLSAQVAAAEPIGRYFTITPLGGFTTFDGDFKFPKNYPLTDNVYAGGRIGYQYNHWLGIEAAGGFTPTRENGAGTVTNPSNPPTAAESDILGDRDADYLI